MLIIYHGISEYSIADRVERRVESPLQRFVRLRQEMAELKSDLDIMVRIRDVDISFP